VSMNLDIDEIRPKVLVGFLGLHLLKNGFTADSVARALSVPESFTTAMANEGIKSHGFQRPSKVCHKSLDAERVTEDEFRISFMLTTVPEIPGWLADENGILKDHIVAHKEMVDRAGNSFDPLNWLEDPAPKDFESEFGYFIKRRCNIGAIHQCDVKEFFDAWTAWAETQGNVEQPSTQVVGRRIKKIFPSVDTPQYRTANGFSRKYIGIGLKDERN
jgi:hypothetical protein